MAESETKAGTISQEFTGTDTSDSEYPPPPDGGWGWMIILASFVVHLISDGTSFAFGVLYVEMLDQFQESSGMTSMIGSLYVSLPMIAGPIAGIIVEHFGCRRAVIFSGAVTAAGYLLSYFATSMEVMCITLGVIAGLGLSTGYVAAIVIIVYYFEKHRSFATGLATCGSGVGCFIFAPLIDFLLEEYGFHGTLLIISGLFMNLIVCGALMRPLQWPDEDLSSNEYSSSDDSELKAPLLQEIDTAPNAKLNLTDQFQQASQKMQIKLLNGQIMVPCLSVHIRNKQKFMFSRSFEDLPVTSHVWQETFLMYECDEKKISCTRPAYHEHGKDVEDETQSNLPPFLNEENGIQTRNKQQNSKVCMDHDAKPYYPGSNLSGIIEQSDVPVCVKQGNSEFSENSKIVSKFSENQIQQSKNCVYNREESVCESDACSAFETVVLQTQHSIPVEPTYYIHSCRDMIEKNNSLEMNNSKGQMVHAYSYPSLLKSSRITSVAEQLASNYSRQVQTLRRRRSSVCRYASDYRKPILGRVRSFCHLHPSVIAQPVRRTSTSSSSPSKIPPRRVSIPKVTVLKQGNPTYNTSICSPQIPLRPPKFNVASRASTLSTKETIFLQPLKEVVLPQKQNQEHISCGMRTGLYKRKATSSPDIYISCQNLSRDSGSCIMGKEKKKTNFFRRIGTALKSTIDISTLKNPMFLLFWISNFVLYMWYDIPYVYITDFAIKLGINRKPAAFLVSIIGIANTFGLITIGYVGDRPKVKALLLYAVCVSICGLSTMLVPYLTTYPLLATIAGVSKKFNLYFFLGFALH